MKYIAKYNPYLYLNGRQKIVFSLFLLLSIPLNLITEPTSGFEGSWRIALNMALNEGIVWGKDFVFTYGPLGFLQTRLSLYVTEIPVILFTLFVWVNVLFMFFYFLKGCRLLPLLDFLIAILIVLMFHYVVKTEVSTTLIYIILFHLLYSLVHKTYVGIVIATITGSLAIFIKLTYFFPLIVIFGLYLVVIITLEKVLDKRRVLLIYGACIIFIVLLCFILRVDFKQYVSAGFHLVGSYNDAMMETPSKESAFTWVLQLITPVASPDVLSMMIMGITLLITLPFLIFSINCLRTNRFNYVAVLTVVLCLIFLFMTFKYAFVRHGGLSYLYPPVLLYLLALLICFGRADRKWLRVYIYFICLILFIPSVLLVNKHLMLRPSFTYYSAIVKLKELIRNNPDNLTSTKNEPFTHIIPDAIIKRIDTGKVDIIPTEISFAYYNKLRYCPRPVIQSYTAYDKYLDNKNFEFYNSNKAPDFVIYSTNTIDNRYHFYDEPKTKFNLLRHYNVIDSFSNQLLLKKRTSIRKTDIVKRQEDEITLNKEYNVNESQFFQLSSFSIQYTAMGSALRFLYQVPIIQITFYLEDGTIHTHRLVKTAVEVPVLVNKYIADNKDFANLFLNKSTSVPTVKKFKIEGPEWAYETTIASTHEWIVINEDK